MIQVLVFARNVTGFIFGICKNPNYSYSYKEAIWKLYVKINVIKYIRRWALTLSCFVLTHLDLT